MDVVCDVGDKSDGEEEVCPICLNELDEGEDLLTCSGCNNQLHQHCMDVCKSTYSIPNVLCCLYHSRITIKQITERVA